MATASNEYRYPAGSGWAAGYLLGVIFGTVAWVIAGEVTIGVIVLAATGAALGAAFEASMDTRPLTPRQRWFVLLLATVGVIVGVIVLAFALLR